MIDQRWRRINRTMPRPNVQFFARGALRKAFTWSTAAHIVLVTSAIGWGWREMNPEATVQLESTSLATSFEPTPVKVPQEPNRDPVTDPIPDAVEFYEPNEVLPEPEAAPVEPPASWSMHPHATPPSLPLPTRDSRLRRPRPAPTHQDVAKAPAPELPEDQPDAEKVPATADKPAAVFVSARQTKKGCPPPRYPSRARRLGLHGRCILTIAVSDRGAVEWVRLIKGSGHSILDRAAIDAVRKWSLTPATHGGKPIASERDVSVLFTMPY